MVKEEGCLREKKEKWEDEFQYFWTGEISQFMLKATSFKLNSFRGGTRKTRGTWKCLGAFLVSDFIDVQIRKCLLYFLPVGLVTWSTQTEASRR